LNETITVTKGIREALKVVRVRALVEKVLFLKKRRGRLWESTGFVTGQTIAEDPPEEKKKIKERQGGLGLISNPGRQSQKENSDWETSKRPLVSYLAGETFGKDNGKKKSTKFPPSHHRPQKKKNASKGEQGQLQ